MDLRPVPYWWNYTKRRPASPAEVKKADDYRFAHNLDIRGIRDSIGIDRTDLTCFNCLQRKMGGDQSDTYGWSRHGAYCPDCVALSNSPDAYSYPLNGRYFASKEELDAYMNGDDI
jgi:hypothetical protein